MTHGQGADRDCFLYFPYAIQTYLIRSPQARMEYLCMGRSHSLPERFRYSHSFIPYQLKMPTIQQYTATRKSQKGHVSYQSIL
jgi:hypothetical protein